MMPAASSHDSSAISAVCTEMSLRGYGLPAHRAPHQQKAITIPQSSALMSFYSTRLPLELPYNTYAYYTQSNSSHNVRPVVDPCSLPTTSHVSPQPLESHLSSSFSHHVSLNYHLQGLASHYGIPIVLPKPPSTAPRRNTSPKPILPNFDLICTNYLNMLSKQSSSNTDDMQTLPIFSVDSTSPMFSDFGDDFLTSPQDDFLTSPLFDNYGGDFSDSSPYDTPLDSFLTTPLFHDIGEPIIAGGEEFSRIDLFGGQDFAPSAVEEFRLPVEKTFSINPSSLIASPAHTAQATKAIEPIATATTPRAVGRSKSRKASAATGTRKNITPESMVPLDAPIQARRYITPSATSRKELPATFVKKKRSRSQAFGEDELEEILPPNATEAEQIEFKRRQNTLAARKSRKRKLEYQQNLETQLQDLQDELAHWKARAEISEGVLKANGLPLPS